MSGHRNNHFIPEWYQKLFLAEGSNTLSYLDMAPPRETLPDGRVITRPALLNRTPSRAFCKYDLYSTFFGTSVNVEIERKLFGDVDRRGADAIRAFCTDDEMQWHRHFETLFIYLDIQKLRTPKGLDWLRRHYPTMTQNELMREMQGIRMINCTIWSEGVREIVSAKDSDTKFILTDHPVTIYNYAAPPVHKLCGYPDDPAIALKASQTLFPLGPDFCLILTNLEYASDPACAPLEKRTFPRSFRRSMVSTVDFIRTRSLDEKQVKHINFILKSRARRFIAAGRKEWLYPERDIPADWKAFRSTLSPPSEEIYRFGGEMYAKFESGHVHYQDAFGRTETERAFLTKQPPTPPLRSSDPCGCGSGKRYSTCCELKPVALRPAWNEKSIRERNLMLFEGICNVLELRQKDWTRVRRDLTDEQVSTVYRIYQSLWPLETDLLHLLPKPDGKPRAVYTGVIHPQHIIEFAMGAPPYFGELVVEHPFLHPGTVKTAFNPIEHPGQYRLEFIASVVFLMEVIPLVDAGIVNLVPDPCAFDVHLREQMTAMATTRNRNTKIDPDDEPRIRRIIEDNYKRVMLSMPFDALRRKFASVPPPPGMSIETILNHLDALRAEDPLAPLQEVLSNQGGQMQLVKLAPNFEIAMYLAQAIGGHIVTDSPARWREIQRASLRLSALPALRQLSDSVESAAFCFARQPDDVELLMTSPGFANLRETLFDASRYISRLAERGSKPNVEARLAARFSHAHAETQGQFGKSPPITSQGRVQCLFSSLGIRDNTINRLLLMSSSERHLQFVPTAFFIS